MKLELLLSYRAVLSSSLEVGSGAFGNRLIVEVDGGEFEGPKLKGRIRNAAAADWLTLSETHGHLDVRATFETHDGAFIYVEYTGKLEMTDAVVKAIAVMAAQTTETSTFSPRLECKLAIPDIHG